MAIVTVQLDEDFGKQGVTVKCTAPRATPPQGYLEDVPADGYEDWKQGALLGSEYALEIAGKKGQSVVVSRIAGLTTDTNPTIVGAAAALGIWEALGYQPTPEQIKHIEGHVFTSWRRSFDALPDFGSIPDAPAA